MSESRPKADPSRLPDGLRRGGMDVAHPVGRMEARDVPGDPRVDPPDEGGEGLEFRSAVVPAGDDQRGHLDPGTHVVQEADVLLHGFEAGAADLPVVLLGKALQVDIGGVQEPPEFPQGRLGHVSVRDEDVPQAAPGRKPGRLQGELEEDRGFGIGIGDAFRSGPEGGLHHLLRPDRIARDPAVVPRGLGDLEVLAVPAAEVAAGAGDGEGPAAGQEVEEGLLLDGVQVGGDHPAVVQAQETAVPVLPNRAEAPFPRRDPASVAAEEAADLPASEGFVQKGLFHGGPVRGRGLRPGSP